MGIHPRQGIDGRGLFVVVCFEPGAGGQGMRGGAGEDMQAVVGLWPCVCGCGRMVRKVKNRNGRVKEYLSDKCRTRHNAEAQRIGRGLMKTGMPAEAIRRALVRAAMKPIRRKRQEYIDIDVMTKQERLGALCRAAEKAGVLCG